MFKSALILLGTISLSFAGMRLQQYTCPSTTVIPKLTCTPPASTPVATNVKQLRPGNIAALLSVGDSITAGFAMQKDPVEYRGWVYSSGGEDAQSSLGNYLKFYNPKLKGLCTGVTVPLSPGCGLSGAVSGAVVQDIPSQIDAIVKRIKIEPEFAGLLNEWKLLSFFIGANNACSCYNVNNNVTNWSNNLRTALKYAQTQLPKTFVNVYTLFNISQVWDDASNSPVCQEKVTVLHECGCLTPNATDRQNLDNLVMQYNVATAQVVAEIASQNDPQFTAVVQPGVQNCAFGSWGEDFLSDVDCFHPSLCTDQLFSVAFWNNMWTAPSLKATCLDHNNVPPLACPSANGYLQ